MFCCVGPRDDGALGVQYVPARPVDWYIREGATEEYVCVHVGRERDRERDREMGGCSNNNSR